MEYYLDEDDFGKCRKHPSRQPRHGVCPVCLKDRLTLLCPNCAHARPCACYAPSDLTSSSSSSASSLDVGVGSVGRVAFLLDREPSFRRSRSTALNFLRLKSSEKSAGVQLAQPETRTRSGSIWPFARSKKKAEEAKKTAEEAKKKSENLMRSKSVGISCYTDTVEISSAGKGKGWYFPSPIKAFRLPKSTKIVHERSPMCRG